MQAFLMAAYGLAHQQRIAMRLGLKKAEPTGALLFGDQVLDGLISLVPVVGLCSTLLVLRSTWVAHVSIMSLEKFWRKAEQSRGATRELPPLTGGGAIHNTYPFFWAPLSIPLLITSAWAGICASQACPTPAHAKRWSLTTAGLFFVAGSLVLQWRAPVRSAPGPRPRPPLPLESTG